MAKFVGGSEGFDQYVTLQVANGDELTPEQVLAWAAVRQVQSLDMLTQVVGYLVDAIKEHKPS